MAEWSSSSRGKEKYVEKSISKENSKQIISSSKVPVFSIPPMTNKENQGRKNLESSGMVKRLKMRYEEISKSRSNVMASCEKKIMGHETGAIKKTIVNNKRPAFTENNNSVTKTSYGSNYDNIITDIKRPRVSSVEDNAFMSSRFNVYTDQQSLGILQKTAGKLHVNRLLSTSIPQSTLENKFFTPTEGLPIQPKTVKVQRRKGLMPVDGKFTLNHAGSFCPVSDIPLLCEDNFVELELKKEKPLSRMSRCFREKSITTNQRKIIIKFLIRINAHSFYPSFFLHQAVRIFDAVLDVKIVPVEELQLVALAAMWIVLKREQIPYKVPSATEMISYAKDLYQGRVELLVKCEREIFQSLNFDIVYPDPFTIMYYCMITCHRSYCLQSNDLHSAYCCGCYMLDLSLVDENLMNKSTALLAAAAAETALVFVMEKRKNGSEPGWLKWRSPDATMRFNNDQISEVRLAYMQKIVESHHRYTDGEIIFKKYSRTRYGKISQFLCSKVDLFLDLD